MVLALCNGNGEHTTQDAYVYNVLFLQFCVAVTGRASSHSSTWMDEQICFYIHFSCTGDTERDICIIILQVYACFQLDVILFPPSLAEQMQSAMIQAASRGD